jgi:hypothetical protein
MRLLIEPASTISTRMIAAHSSSSRASAYQSRAADRARRGGQSRTLVSAACAKPAASPYDEVLKLFEGDAACDWEENPGEWVNMVGEHEHPCSGWQMTR